jgi:mxaD protein
MPHVEMSTVVRTDPNTLWREIGAFERVGDWHPLLNKVQIEGRRRIPYDKNGIRHVETLQESDPQQRRYRYTIDESPMPISNYTAELSVHDNHDGTSTVRWSGDFDVPDRDRAKTVATVEGFFKAGLTSLRGRHG